MTKNHDDAIEMLDDLLWGDLSVGEPSEDDVRREAERVAGMLGVQVRFDEYSNPTFR